MSERATGIGFAVIALFLMVGFIGAVWIQVGVWRECRAEGHSRPYCLSLVLR